MSSVSKRKKEGSRGKIKTMGDHKEFLQRITKTLYYGQLPALPCLSLPVTEIACEVWSMAQRGRSLRRLRADAAAATARAACVSPCALVLALLYVERLQRCNPDYLTATDPEQLFLVSLMVSNKFLQDDGEDDEVICSEWATSGGLTLDQLKRLELDFLNAIEWKVFVSARSFSAGLARLERRVALRQAGARGWFTYADLAAAAPPALHAAALVSLAAATAAAALLTSALLVAHALSDLRDLPDLASPTRHSAHRTDLSPNLHADPVHIYNATVELDIKIPSERLSDVRCCRGWHRWHRYIDEGQNRTPASGRDERAPPAWWARASVVEWLYRSALVDPLQRWLEMMMRYSDLFDIGDPTDPSTRCDSSEGDPDGRRCVTGWLNLSRLSIYAAAVSDR